MLVDLKSFEAEEERQYQALMRKHDIIDKFELTTIYTPPGPVAAAFINDWAALTNAIMGPIGSGKTTACVFKRILAATRAPIARHPKDGKPTRMCRAIVLRDTFRSAEKSVLESWKSWFPKGYAASEHAGGNDRPVTHTLRFIGGDGVRIEIITEFAGLNDLDIETMLKGREYSIIWLNEADTHAPGAIGDAESRVGRYPAKDILLTVAEIEDLERKLGHKLESGRRMAMVICDFNAPVIDNHVVATFIDNIHNTPDRRFYRQPGGREPNAENRMKLEHDYYDRIARNGEPDFVRRAVDNQLGYSRGGKPVFDTFDFQTHVAKREIGFDASLDLIIGVDLSTGGLNPAATFLQVRPNGQIVFIDEYGPGHGTGVSRFAENLKLRLAERYGKARNVRIYVDPAAENGGDKEGGQTSGVDMLAIILERPVLLVDYRSQALIERISAVKQELRGWLEPNTALLICPVRCPILIKGMRGDYRYKKMPKDLGGAQYEDKPEKNHPVSDVMDGAQYGILGLRGRQSVIGDKGRDVGGTGRSEGKPAKRNGPRGSFNPHSVGLGRR